MERRKNMFKFKICSLLLVISLIGGACLPANAIDYHDVPVDGSNYDIITQNKTDSSYAGFSGVLLPSTPTKNVIVPNGDVVDENDIASPYLFDPTWYQLDNMSSFIYYAQETNYSCTAACARMALRYLTGNYYTEETVREGCKVAKDGGALSDVVEYVNAELDQVNYSYIEYATKTFVKDNLYTAIVTKDAPAIIAVCESTEDGWPFDLPVHAVTIYSITSTKSDVAIADPWGGYVSSTSPYRWFDMSMNDLYAAHSVVGLAGFIY